MNSPTPRRRGFRAAMSFGVAVATMLALAPAVEASPLEQKRAEAARLALEIENNGERISAAAEKANTDARSLLADYQGKLASADAEIRQMIEKAKREAEQAGQKIVERARGEAEAEKRRAIADIELATAGALEDLASRSATLAVQLAGKIVRAELTPADHSALVDEAVAEFSRFEPGKN